MSGFTKAEREAMAARLEEVRAAKKGSAKAEREDKACLDAIAKLPDADRAMAERLHVIVLETAPELRAKTMYGMPAYHRDGTVVVFFQAASKFETRYSTVGFDEGANLDDGAMWPMSFALTALGEPEEKALRELVARAVS